MLKKTIDTIEEKIHHVDSMADETKTELLHLLSTLKGEIAELSETQSEKAESITGFTQISAHEATRVEKNPDLLNLSLTGLRSSVSEFETTHPKLAETVNSICHILSNMGI